MRLLNVMNAALALVFIILGVFLLPFEEYALRIGIALAVLIVTFLLTLVGKFGGGDTKYLAALMPFVKPADFSVFVTIFAMSLVTAFLVHRLVRGIPAVRSATSDWKSWTSVKFPMGFAMSGAILLYLAPGAFNFPAAIG